MKRLNFQTKLSIIFIALVSIILLITIYFLYQIAFFYQKEEIRNKLLNLAKFSSISISGDKCTQIKPVKESENTILYKEIKQSLKKIRDIDSLVDNVYLMIKTNKENIWQFIVDSGDRENLSSYCGELYDISHFEEMKQAFDMPIVDKKYTKDKWGFWLSGYAPIYNQQGKAVAMVGLDIEAKSVKKMQMMLAKSFLIFFVFGIFLSLLLSWIISKKISRPLNNLILSVKEIEKGNFEKKVNIKTNDEIQDLAITFNNMTDNLQKTQTKLQSYYLNTIQALARALEAKDPYTRNHSNRVTEYSIIIAKHLGLGDKEIDILKNISILHDIGKIGIPENILLKPDALSDEEWQIIKTHPSIGAEILKDIEFLQPGISIIRDHHERPDGKGYPRKLKADEISLFASIVSVADAFDAMISDRAYRKAFTREKAISILQENKGTQFNTHVVDTFVSCLEKHPFLFEKELKYV